MERILKVSVVLLVVIAILTTTVNAATPSYAIGLSSKTEAKRGEEITVTVIVKDFANMTGGLYAFFAEIEYDKNFFEELTQDSVAGRGSWSSIPTFNPANNQITADSGVGVKTEGEVFTIKFKVKSNALVGANTTIKVKNFVASEGDTEIDAKGAASIEIKIVDTTPDSGNNNNAGTNDNTNNNNNAGTNNNTNNNNNAGTNNDTNNNNNAGTNNGTNNNNNAGTNNGTNNNNNSGTNNNTNNNNNTGTNNNSNTNTVNKLPQTGEENWFVLGGIALIIVAIISYRKSRREF